MIPIPADVISRVFCLKRNQKCGTCFTIELDNRQYLVTAKHLVEDIQGKDRIEILHGREWKYLDVSLVGHCDENTDISVLAASHQLSPQRLVLRTDTISYGQDVYFLGFPLPHLDFYPPEPLNRGYPMPFIKKAIFSLGTGSALLLDGHNNAGFSGGPVLYTEYGENNYQIAAVISAYFEEPVSDGKNDHKLYAANAGIIVSYSIEEAIKIIKSNPVGLPLVERT